MTATAPRSAERAAAPETPGRLRRTLSGIRWYVETLMGDRAYATYLEHHRAQHPDAAPLSERAFWKERMDEQDRNPGARCC